GRLAGDREVREREVVPDEPSLPFERGVQELEGARSGFLRALDRPLVGRPASHRLVDLLAREGEEVRAELGALEEHEGEDRGAARVVREERGLLLFGEVEADGVRLEKNGLAV